MSSELPSEVRTRAEREAIARRLRADGLKFREIAERMGVAISTVDSWLNDPGGTRLKARQATYAGRCVDCGAVTDGHAGPGKASQRCMGCNGRQAAIRERRRWLTHRVQIEAMWADGYTMRQIADEMGMNYEKAMLSKLRARGYDMPYRRTPEQVARINVGAQERMAKARRVWRQMKESDNVAA